jgi:DNA repair exonuclease SbcCD ATPase subunit
LSSRIVVNDKELNELQSLYDHQKFLVKLLVDKNSFIRKNIISKTIPFLNKRIAYYTEKLNLPHVVLFQSDMSCEISQIGRILDHGNLSNGEKKKLNLSLCLAFRDVLSYLHDKVNVLFTDEIDGGSISGPDVDSLVSMIKSKAWDDDISIFVISHRPEFDGRCDKFMVVRKENGFSTLIEQPD